MGSEANQMRGISACGAPLFCRVRSTTKQQYSWVEPLEPDRKSAAICTALEVSGILQMLGAGSSAREPYALVR